MRAIVLVVSDKEKDISSTSGMETSKATSVLLAHRAASVVQGRLDEIEAAYLARDFETFGRITMQDSNQFHAVCLDTYPPIFYMNDISKSIIHLVHAINNHFGCVKAAYTFDAGPNAVIYTLEKVYYYAIDNFSLLFSCGFFVSLYLPICDKLSGRSTGDVSNDSLFPSSNYSRTVL